MVVSCLQASSTHVIHDAFVKALALAYMDVKLVEQVHGNVDDVCCCVWCGMTEVKVFVWEVGELC